MLLPYSRRSTAGAGAWLAVCVAAFLQPSPALAGVADYDEWFFNSLDRRPPDALPWTPYSWTPESEMSQFFLVAASKSEGLEAETPENWACILDPVTLPVEGRSAGILGVEDQRLNPESAIPRGPLAPNPDDWPTYFGWCAMIGVAMIAAARCFHFVQRAGGPGSDGPPVQCYNAPRQVFVYHFSELGVAHGVSQFVGFREAAYRFGQVHVGIAASRNYPANPG
jgi:hypothetical protein